MNQSKAIDLVLPVLNPQKGWAQQTIQHKFELEKTIERKVRLIVSDDGSSDKTELDELTSLDKSCLVLSSEKNQGKGSALRLGFSHSDADIAVFTDADFPYDMRSMKRVIESLEAGADVSLGYRQDDYYASVPWFRKSLSEAFRFILKSILKFPITDTQCGLKGLSPAGKSVFLKTSINRFLVDMEFIKLASRDKSLRIQPVVVQLRPNVEFSSMGSVVLVRELINFIKVVFT